MSTGPCASWTPIWTCALPVGSEAVSGAAVSMATEVLWAMSGRRFGLCTLSIRPCRRNCYGASWWSTGNWWEYGTYPTPLLQGGLWYNITCGGGSCVNNCSCSRISEVALPGPVKAITQVKVDGAALTKNVDYRLDNHYLLVRLGGFEWPLCNDLNKLDTEIGTWVVNFTVGEDVPPLGQMAVGVLGVEFIKALLCNSDCALPKPVQSIARQGVNVTFLDPNEVFADGRTGLYIPDLFVNTYNPNKLKRRSRAYDVDNLVNYRHLNTG